MRALRHVGRWRVGRVRMGRTLAQAIYVAMLGTLALGWLRGAGVDPKPSWHNVRARIVADLARTGGKHLVLVRYTPEHFVHAEWVYNAADIDAAPVVWADEMDAAANARLLEHFKDRRVWLVEPDRAEVRAVPYVALAAS